MRATILLFLLAACGPANDPPVQEPRAACLFDVVLGPTPEWTPACVEGPAKFITAFCTYDPAASFHPLAPMLLNQGRCLPGGLFCDGWWYYVVDTCPPNNGG